MTQPLGTPADPINPQHYQGFSNGAEVIDITENLTGNGAQAVGYIARSTRIDGKNKGAEVEDLEKAIWFIKREIERLTPRSTNAINQKQRDQYASVITDLLPEGYHCEATNKAGNKQSMWIDLEIRDKTGSVVYSNTAMSGQRPVEDQARSFFKNCLASIGAESSDKDDVFGSPDDDAPTAERTNRGGVVDE